MKIKGTFLSYISIEKKIRKEQVKAKAAARRAADATTTTKQLVEEMAF